MDYDIHFICVVLQELAAAGLVRYEKADGAPAAEESTFPLSIVLITAGWRVRANVSVRPYALDCSMLVRLAIRYKRITLGHLGNLRCRVG